MTRIAFFDLAHGISGDMATAALAHVGRKIGLDVEGAVVDAVASLGLDCQTTFVEDERGGFAGVRAEVKTGGDRYSGDQIRAAIERSNAPARAVSIAAKGLDALLEAEASVHGVDVASVHLHELASSDTAADLVGVGVAVDRLGISEVASAPIPLAAGSIDTEHGAMPLPAPAALELVVGARVRGVSGSQELVTPTGAAILVALDAAFGDVPDMVLEATGIGCGERRTTVPNISRVLLGSRATDGARLESCVVLETNIDDQTPEAFGYAIEELTRLGALDVWITHIVMKKSRPAFLLSVLVSPPDEARLTEAIFKHTTTIGVRRRETARYVLERQILTVSVRGQSVRVKVARLRDDAVNVAPEYDDCVRVSRAEGLSLKLVMSEATEAARRVLTQRG